MEPVNSLALKLRAVINHPSAATIAPADDFAFLLHGCGPAYRAGDDFIRALKLVSLGLILVCFVQLLSSY